MALDTKKGADIVIRDVRGVSELADYTVVATAGSSPHLKALLNEVQHVLKDQSVPTYRRAGNPESGWLVIDYLDVVIHIFLAEVRQYYAIEALWEKAPVIPLPRPGSPR